jgi:hypothetical protein
MPNADDSSPLKRFSGGLPCADTPEISHGVRKPLCIDLYAVPQEF